MAQELDLQALSSALAEHADVQTGPVDEVRELGAWGVRPRLICRPATAEALASAVAVCDRAGAGVIPWGGGSQLGLGAPARAADVALVVAGLDRILEFEPANLTATVEAGMTLRAFQSALGERGQWLPVDPPLPEEATIGGLVATNVNGPRRWKEGGLRDLVIGTRVANVNGTLSRAGGRVVKNVTGYDLNKLHIGALGTLGVLTEVTFKVAPRPASERVWAGVFRSAGEAWRAYSLVSRQPLAPSALECVNGRLADEIGLSVGEGRWALLARASGFPPAVGRHLAEFERAGLSAEVLEAETLPEERGAAVFAAYQGAAAERRWRAESLTCRLAVPPAEVGRLCDRAAAVGQSPVVWAHAWGNVFWSPGAGEAGGAEIETLRNLAQAAGGRLVVENWRGAAAELNVWGEPAGPVSLMRALKAQYDPRHTLNPGRYVGGL